MITEIIFDLETKKIFDDIDDHNPASLGVSLVCAYRRQLDDNFTEIDGQMYSFWEKDFPSLWSLFSNANRIIGFNSLHFDVPALLPLCPYDLKKLNHFDILDHIKNTLGFRLSLNSVATATLGSGKIDHGLNAVDYWNQQTVESLAKLEKYCRMDVLLTRDVYDFGLHHHHLKYIDKWNTPRQLEINFSYPPPSNQIGLF